MASSLMQELTTCLVAGLSPGDTERHEAEQRLNALAAQSGYAPALAQLSCVGVDAGVGGVAGSVAAAPLEVRQLGLLVLKGFVHGGKWGALPPAEQAQVRALLLRSVSDPAPLIRTAVGTVIGSIARADWPERWPDLLQVLVGHVRGGVPTGVAGAVRCLQIFTDDISDTQLLPALEVLWPVLRSAILQQLVEGRGWQHGAIQSGIDAQTCARCMGIVYSLMSMLGNCIGTAPAETRELLLGVVESCMDLCFQTLLGRCTNPAATQQQQQQQRYGLAHQAVRTAMLLVGSFPKCIRASLGSVLPATVQLLHSARTVYQQQVDGTHHGDVVAYDEDGSSVGLESYVVQLVELVCAFVENRRFASLLKPHLEHIAQLLVELTQVTEAQLETWSVDINQYVLEECDDSIECSVRISAQHVLQEMSRVLGEVGQVAIFKAAQICLQSAVEQHQQHGGVEGRWWKLRESGLLAIGVLIEDTESDSFFGAGASDTPAGLLVDTRALVHELLAGELVAVEAVHPVLYSRALVAAAQSCQAMMMNDGARGMGSSGGSKQFLDTCVAVLEATGNGLSDAASPMIKLSACRAVNRLVPCVKRLGEAGMDCLGAFAAPLLHELCSLLPQADDEDMLHSLFETLLVAVGANAVATLAAEPMLTRLLVQIWSTNMHDPNTTWYVLSALDTMVKSSRECAAEACAKLVPHICGMLGEGRQLPDGAVPSAIDLLTVLVGSERAGGGDMAKHNLAQAYVLVTRLGGADGPEETSVDHSVLQNVAECTRAFLRSMPEQVCSLTVTQGVTGLHRAVAVVCWLLSADVDDSAAMQVGPLISTMIRRCGHVLGSVVTDILRMLVARVRSAHMPSFIGELMLVLAHLTNQQGGQQTVDFLCSCDRDSSALVLIVTHWLEVLAYMSRPYETRVICAAVAAVCATRDPRLLVITLETSVETGADAAGEGAVASRTRSARSAATRKLAVPLSVVAMRNLMRAVGREELHEKERATNSLGIFAVDVDDDDDEDGDNGDGGGDGGGAEDWGLCAGDGGGSDDSDCGEHHSSSTCHETSSFAVASDFAHFEQFLEMGDGGNFEDESDEDEDPDDLEDEIYHTTLKTIVSSYARGVYDAMGSQGFSQECALFTPKERAYMQSILIATA